MPNCLKTCKQWWRKVTGGLPEQLTRFQFPAEDYDGFVLVSNALFSIDQREREPFAESLVFVDHLADETVVAPERVR
jgi:hypothetical protein